MKPDRLGEDRPFWHAKSLATPKQQFGRSPNADTPYSVAWLNDDVLVHGNDKRVNGWQHARPTLRRAGAHSDFVTRSAIQCATDIVAHTRGSGLPQLLRQSVPSERDGLTRAVMFGSLPILDT